MTDVIRFKCSACGASMKVPGNAAGKKTKCPKCNNPEKVPEAQLPAVIEKPRLPTKVKPAPILEMVDDDVFVADMLKEIPTKEQSITIRETKIVSRESARPTNLDRPLPEIKATPVVQPDTPFSPPTVPPSTQNNLVACKFCGEDILATAVKCKHCGEFLDGRQSPQSQVVVPNIIVNNNSNNVNSDFGKPSASPGSTRALAALLSFLFPGLGHFYRGENTQGVIWVLITVIGYAVFVPLGAIFHICSIVAAMVDTTGESRNRRG